MTIILHSSCINLRWFEKRRERSGLGWRCSITIHLSASISRFEDESSTIDAKSLARFERRSTNEQFSIQEHIAQMASTGVTSQLSPSEAHLNGIHILYFHTVQGGGKRRPACATVKFLCRLEQGRSATGTNKVPGLSSPSRMDE